MLAEASATDVEEDRLHGTDRGDELPVDLRDRGGRLARLAQAKTRLQAEEAERQRALWGCSYCSSSPTRRR